MHRRLPPIFFLVLTFAILPLTLSASPGPAGELDCPALPRGGGAALTPGVLLLLGEIHGTREAPAATAALACQAASSGPVRVGLEMPVQESGRLAEVLAEPDDGKARELLLAAEFFQRSYQDGRASAAMADLVGALREWKRAGADIELYFFDPAAAGDRDRIMGENIATARRAAPQATHLVLTGNIHAMNAKGTPWNKNLETTAFVLAREGLEPVTVKILNAPGTAWTCNGSTADSCGERKLGGGDRGKESFLTMGGDDLPRGYDGILYLGAKTASPPAKQ